jgi:hypothetical protein
MDFPSASGLAGARPSKEKLQEGFLPFSAGGRPDSLRGRDATPFLQQRHETAKLARFLCARIWVGTSLFRLVAQPQLMQKLHLTVNEDIKSRVTYSVRVLRLNPDDMKAFLYAQCDAAGLGHNAFSDDAIALIVRSSEGLLRRLRNLCISAMLEAVRDRKQVIGLDQVNRVLMQPHWRKDHDLSAPN